MQQQQPVERLCNHKGVCASQSLEFAPREKDSHLYHLPVGEGHRQLAACLIVAKYEATGCIGTVAPGRTTGVVELLNRSSPVAHGVPAQA